MTFTYKFTQDLQKLLHQENWNQNLHNRITKINSIIDKSPEDKLQHRLDFRTQNNKPPYSQKIQNAIIKKAEKRELKLRHEKSELEECLKQNSYKLGLAPFEVNANVSLLLRNIQLLEAEKFNLVSVNAVKNMLKDNFQLLYRNNKEVQKINQKISDFDPWLRVDKYLSGEKLETTDIVPDLDKLQPEQKKDLDIITKIYNSLDIHLVQHCYNKLRFISLFYNSGLEQDHIFYLASYFNTTDDIDNYLNLFKHSSIKTMLDGLFSGNFYDYIQTLSVYTKEELTIWREFNASYGASAIKLFRKSHLLKNNVNIKDILSGGGDVLFNVQEVLKGNKFAREDENPIIAEYCHQHHKESTYNMILDEILPRVKKYDKLPNIKFKFEAAVKGKISTYCFRKLEIGEEIALFSGDVISSCMTFGGEGNQCAITAYTNPNAQFYYITNINGTVISTIYTLLGEAKSSDGQILEGISFDTFPLIPRYHGMFLKAAKEFKEHLLKEKSSSAHVFIENGYLSPRVDAKTEFPFTPIEGTYRYSKNDVFEVMDNIELLLSRSATIDNKFSDFQSFCQLHPLLQFQKIYELHKDKMDFLDSNYLIKNSSVLIFHILSHFDFSEVTNYLRPYIDSYGRKCTKTLPSNENMTIETLNALDKVLQNPLTKVSIDQLQTAISYIYAQEVINAQSLDVNEYSVNIVGEDFVDN